MDARAQLTAPVGASSAAPRFWISAPVWQYLACVIIAFIVLRLPVFFITVTPVSDDAWYVHRAIDIAAGRGYTENGIPTAWWPVGYPGFLAGLFTVFGPNLLAVKLSNLAFGIGSIYLIYDLSKLMFQSEAAARLAVIFYTLYPNQVAYTAFPESEPLFTLMLLGALGIFARKPGLVGIGLAGAVLGAATLVKAQTILFPGFLLLVYGWMARRQVSLRRLVTSFVIMYSACFLVISPWTLRNYRVFDSFVPVATSGGTALYMGNNPKATGRDQNIEELLPILALPRAPHQLEIDKEAKSAAIAWITAHPWQVVALMPKKIWYLWARDGEGEWGFEAGYARYVDQVLTFRTLRWINQFYYLALMMLSVLAVYQLRRRPGDRNQWWYLGVIVVLHTTIVSMIFTGQPRYHFPAMPWVCMYAAWFTVCGNAWKVRRA